MRTGEMLIERGVLSGAFGKRRLAVGDEKRVNERWVARIRCLVKKRKVGGGVRARRCLVG